MRLDIGIWFRLGPFFRSKFHFKYTKDATTHQKLQSDTFSLNYEPFLFLYQLSYKEDSVSTVVVPLLWRVTKPYNDVNL